MSTNKALLKKIRCQECRKLAHKKPDCRLIDKIPKEEWQINKIKLDKKKVNDQQNETSDKKTSNREESYESSSAGNVVESHSRAHTFGCSRVHLRPKGSASSHKKHKTKEKFTRVRRVEKQPKIKVNHQMSDVILLDSVLQATIFKQKYFVDKMFISKGKHCTHYSGD